LGIWKRDGKRTEARTQKEGLGTGDLLNHFDSIDMIDDIGVVQLENIPQSFCVTQYHVNRYRGGVLINQGLAPGAGPGHQKVVFTACCVRPVIFKLSRERVVEKDIFVLFDL
jgi:hypothetical protein